MATEQQMISDGARRVIEGLILSNGASLGRRSAVEIIKALRDAGYLIEKHRDD